MAKAVAGAMALGAGFAAGAAEALSVLAAGTGIRFAKVAIEKEELPIVFATGSEILIAGLGDVAADS